jgi:hypothetical protein
LRQWDSLLFSPLRNWISLSPMFLACFTLANFYSFMSRSWRSWLLSARDSTLSYNKAYQVNSLLWKMLPHWFSSPLIEFPRCRSRSWLLPLPVSGSSWSSLCPLTSGW